MKQEADDYEMNNLHQQTDHDNITNSDTTVMVQYGSQGFVLSNINTAIAYDGNLPDTSQGYSVAVADPTQLANVSFDGNIPEDSQMGETHSESNEKSTPIVTVTAQEPNSSQAVVKEVRQ